VQLGESNSSAKDARSRSGMALCLSAAWSVQSGVHREDHSADALRTAEVVAIGTRAGFRMMNCKNIFAQAILSWTW
jgi:hypothetical protein